jgi:hypothetical protein
VESRTELLLREGSEDRVTVGVVPAEAAVSLGGIDDASGEFTAPQEDWEVDFVLTDARGDIQEEEVEAAKLDCPCSSWKHPEVDLNTRKSI